MTDNRTPVATTLARASIQARQPLRLRSLAPDRLGKWVYATAAILFVVQIIMLVLFDIL